MLDPSGTSMAMHRTSEIASILFVLPVPTLLLFVTGLSSPATVGSDCVLSRTSTSLGANGGRIGLIRWVGRGGPSLGASGHRRAHVFRRIGTGVDLDQQAAGRDAEEAG